MRDKKYTVDRKKILEFWALLLLNRWHSSLDNSMNLTISYIDKTSLEKCNKLLSVINASRASRVNRLLVTKSSLNIRDTYSLFGNVVSDLISVSTEKKTEIHLTYGLYSAGNVVSLCFVNLLILCCISNVFLLILAISKLTRKWLKIFGSIAWSDGLIWSILNPNCCHRYGLRTIRRILR